MSKRIRGSFPGGPRPGSPREESARAPRLERVSEIEDRISRRMLERSRGRRTRRALLGFTCVAALAGGLGGWIGLRSHRTQADLTEAQQTARQKDVDISKEVNRTLLQLWKMEDVEAMRNKGLIR